MMAPRTKRQSRVVRSDDEEEGEGATGRGGNPDIVAKILSQVEKQHLYQPIEPKQGEAKMKVMITDLMVAKNDLSKILVVLSEAAADVAEMSAAPAGEEDDLGPNEIPEDPVVIKELDKEFRSILDTVEETAIRIKVLSTLRQRFAQQHVINDLSKDYSDLSSKLLAEFKAKTTRQRYGHSEEYSQFRVTIWDCLHPGIAAPNVKRFLPREQDDPTESDDEIEIGAQVSDFRCPITLTTLVDPLCSVKCPHVFSRAAFIELLADRRVGHCPVAGCPQKLGRDDVVRDPAFVRRLEAFVRREEEERSAGVTARNATQFETIDSDEDS